MGLDIRWPIGLMFTLIGVLLTFNGLITGSDAEMYKRSLGYNVNLWWGLVLLVFGVFMLVLAVRGQRQAAAEKAAQPQELAGKK
jgi:protein-S-isoprenylcysteine O-methyltransferase Ste14